MAPRDLYDLWALNERGLIDADAQRVFDSHGKFRGPLPEWAFIRAPDEDDWRRALSHQTVLRVSATEALDAVREAWQRAGL